MRTSASLEKWAASIRRLANSQQATQTVTLHLENVWAREVLKTTTLAELMLPYLKAYVKEQVLGPKGILFQEFHKRSKSGDSAIRGVEYMLFYQPADSQARGQSATRSNLKFLGEDYRRRQQELALRASMGEGSLRDAIGDDGLSDEEEADELNEGGLDERVGSTEKKRRKVKRQKVYLDDGFVALWNTIKNSTTYHVEGTQAVANIGAGDAIMGLKLSDYSKLSGGEMTDTRLDSLFLAVEYGTGIAENVGSESWVRKGGPGVPHKDELGRWWVNVSKEVGVGAMFTGQKGFHFLHDARTRTPLPLYEDTFRRDLPDFMRRATPGQIGTGFIPPAVIQ